MIFWEISVKFMMSVFVIRHHAFTAQSKNLFHSVCSSVSVGGTWRRNICINTSRKYLPAEQSSEIRLSVLFTLVILIMWLFDVKHCKKQNQNTNCDRESQTSCFQLQDFGRVFSLVSFGAEWKALHKKESESMKSGEFPPLKCGDMALQWLGKSFETQTNVHTKTYTQKHVR